MSSPPPRNSGSPYIIICNGRIRVRVAKTSEDLILAASECASQLVLYMGIRYRTSLDVADLLPISVIQHEFMDRGKDMTKGEVAQKVDDLFAEMDALEAKYSGATY